VRIFQRVILVSILLLPSTPFLARAQSRQDLGGGFSNGEAQQTTSVIHSTTRLVQMSVVVTDRKGQPITGLKKEDFTLLDEGTVQDIAFFSTQATGIAPAEGAPVLAPNVYTNRFDLKGQKPGTVTIVLFDSLNTAPEDQANVREQVIRFLKSLKPEWRCTP